MESFKENELLNALYNAKMLVESRAREIYKQELKLNDPVIISSREIENFLNNTEISIKDLQIKFSFPPNFEEVKEGIELNLIDFNKIEETLMKIKEYFDKEKFLVYEIRPSGITNLPKLYILCTVSLTFPEIWRCKFADLYSFHVFLKNNHINNIIITKYETDENFKKLLGENFEPSGFLVEFYSLAIIYDDVAKKFLVNPTANAERGYVFVKERLENWSPIHQLSIGIHEYSHKIGKLIYDSLTEKEIKRINEIILKRVEEFCRINNLPMEIIDYRIIITTPDDRKIEVAYDQNHLLLRHTSSYFLTSEAVVELETLKILKENNLDSTPLKEFRVKEIENAEWVRKILIYAGYLTAHDVFKEFYGYDFGGTSANLLP